MSTLLSRKKIVILTGIYPHFNGGAEYQMRIIADQLKSEYEIVFVYLGDIDARPVSKTYSEFKEGYKVYYLQSPSRLDELFLRVFYARRLYKLLKYERPDFVYQRVLKFVSFYVSKFQKKLEYRHIIHIADLYTLQFKQTTFRNNLAYYFFKKTVNHRPRFVVQTKEQGKLLGSYGVASYAQIYNMHPTPLFSAEVEAEKKNASNVKTLVWVGNIRPIKRLDIFLDFATSYQEDTSLQFIVVGNPLDSEYAEHMLTRMRALANVTHYIGKDNEFVNDLITQKAHLTVNTSESEGFSNVFIQSWLRGVPVLSLNSNPDGLFDNHEELGVYCSDSLDVFENSVSKIVFNVSYIENAKRCREVAKSLFSLRNIDKIKELFLIE